ncbi:MAG: endonuclease V [Verrucomicrobia bacterium]|nr:endonuclease V [Cytophagales bacterium]
MKICIDVDYQVDKAQAACLVFENWEDEKPLKTYTAIIKNIAEYVPGEFYKREMPCILAVLKLVSEKIDMIIIDGFVWLNGKKGLGGHLYETLANNIPIIGVAKSNFKGADLVTEVFRGESERPLFVSSVGTDQKIADNIKKMHGNFRIPTLLKLVDSVCRDWKE